MTTRRHALALFGAAAAGSALVACGGAAPVATQPISGEAAPQWTMEKANVSASTTSVNHMWAQWGTRQGIYKKHFLDVTVIDNVADGVAALAAGQIDFLASGATTFAGAVRGAPIRSQMLTFRDNYALVVDPRITSFDALKGKRIIGTSDMMKAAIAKKGLNPDKDVTWVTSRGTTDQNIELVRKGEAEGVAGFPPLQYIAENAGLKTLLLTSDVFPGAPVSNTSSSIETATKRGDYVRRMIAANLEIMAHLKANKPMVIDFFKTSWAQDAAMAERSYGVIEKDMFKDGKTESDSLQTLVDVTAAVQGNAAKVPYTAVFDFAHLNAVLAAPGRY